MIILGKIESFWAKTSSDRFVWWLRRRGVKVGDQVVFHQRKNVTIDLTRPCLLEIGNNVHFTQGLTILTHGYDWIVLRNLFHEVIASSGKVTVGNNVFIGYNVTILKGVSIGDNSIIGAGSVVTGRIPANSVAAGNPARVICTIEEYYQKRRQRYIEEAKEYARCIWSQYRRLPVPADFWEEFPIFLDGNESCNSIDIKRQLGNSFTHYTRNHKSIYRDFSAFLDDCGLEGYERIH
jgi:acetyltransferase-like isoleucine patch superfamily enzyme